MSIDELLPRHLQPDQSNNGKPPAFPFITDGDEWKTISSSDRPDWASGFWTGTHWIASDSGLIDEEKALELTREIDLEFERNYNTGFRFQYSWVPAFETTGKSRYKLKALQGAERLSRCYFPDLSIVGNMTDDQTIVAANNALMNLPLLLWADNQTPDSTEYRRYLDEFLTKATELFVKPSGAVRHRIHYDRETQSIQAVDTDHGLAGGCWSRGLAWTVYGLVLGGIYLDDDHYLTTAKVAMDYHIENSYNLIPAFDYSISTLKKPELTDTSAAAILACAMLTLGKYEKNEQAEELGQQITKTLFEKYRRGPDRDGLIDGGCFHYPEEEGINEATVWGDFYALEARYLMENGELPSYLSWIKRSPAVRAKAS
ncbi:MAG: hypothetical protein ABEK50_04665 [bacterium]